MPSVPSLARDESQAQTRRALTECRSGPSLIPAPAVRFALAPPWQCFCQGALQLKQFFFVFPGLQNHKHICKPRFANRTQNVGDRA